MDRRVLIVFFALIMISGVIITIRSCENACSFSNTKFAPEKQFAGKEVEFSTESEAENITWEFGDGSSAEGISVKHSFNFPGNYKVIAKAGDCVSETLLVEVITKPETKKIAAVLNIPKPIKQNEQVIFTDETPGIIKYEWSTDEPGQTSSIKNFPVTFSQPGTHKITLRGTGDYLVVDTVFSVVVVKQVITRPYDRDPGKRETVIKDYQKQRDQSTHPPAKKRCEEIDIDVAAFKELFITTANNLKEGSNNASNNWERIVKYSNAGVKIPISIKGDNPANLNLGGINNRLTTSDDTFSIDDLTVETPTISNGCKFVIKSITATKD